MNKKVNERFGQDGTHAISHPKTANRTNKAATYYLTVGENESVTNYDGFVMSNKQLTKSLSKNDFNHAAKTIKPEVIIAAAKEIVKRYGKDKYIHVWRDKYSFGPMTGKQHGREGVVDIWIPSIKAWKYGLELSNITEAEKVNEFENSPLIKGSGYKSTNSSTANSCAQDAVTSNVIKESINFDNITTKAQIIEVLNALMECVEELDSGNVHEHNKLMEAFEDLVILLEEYEYLPENKQTEDTKEEKQEQIKEKDELDSKIEEALKEIYK